MDEQQTNSPAPNDTDATKKAKMDVIYSVIQRMASRGLVTAHSTWMQIGAQGITPRPSSSEEFRHLVAAMVSTGRLKVTLGNIDSPLTKIYLRPGETPAA